MKYYSQKKYISGQAMLTAILFFTFISTAIVFGVVTPVIQQVRISFLSHTAL